MTLHLLEGEGKIIEMEKDEEGYFRTTLSALKPATNYMFCPEGGKPVPDPASYYQPNGVHSYSQIVDHHAFKWNDESWKGIPFQQLILYELHVGTFTPEGTFDAIIPRLDELIDTGINAIELLPITQFPGNRNWGYDGVFPYAVQNSYGGPDALKRLVNACHTRGIAVFLDVVYNHLGPEGNYLREYGPYFTNTYTTPWGEAINFDGEWSDGVRDYFCNNVLYWFTLYHVDGLRLDAIHKVYDNGAVHFWQYVNEKVHQWQFQLGRPLHMVAESDLNSPRVVQGLEMNGFGFDAQWLDDFHHALYVMLDKNGKKRYVDFGAIEQLAKAYTDGFVHSGEHVKFRKRRHGTSSAGISGDRFVAFNLNHDQVGNRPAGERLCMLVNGERLKLAGAALMFSPYVPMLFMGEEYADESPFYYFVSHSDPQLVEAVRKGRKEEFKDYPAEAQPPDAQDENTFLASALRWHKRTERKHQLILNWHRTIIRLRKETPALKNFSKNDIRTYIIDPLALVVHRQLPGGKKHVLCLFNFSETEVAFTFPSVAWKWMKRLDSKEKEWMLDAKDHSRLPQQVAAGEKVQLPPLSAILYTDTAQ